MFGKRDLLPLVLVLVGGLNWGLVGIAKFDLVAAIFGLDFGETNAATRIVYGLVGLSAVYGLGWLAAGRRSEGHSTDPRVVSGLTRTTTERTS